MMFILQTMAGGPIKAFLTGNMFNTYIKAFKTFFYIILLFVSSCIGKYYLTTRRKDVISTTFKRLGQILRKANKLKHRIGAIKKLTYSWCLPIRNV